MIKEIINNGRYFIKMDVRYCMSVTRPKPNLKMDGRIPTTDNKANCDSVIVTSVDTGKSSETESDRLTVLERWLASPKTTDSEERLRERISLPFNMWKDTFPLLPENEHPHIEDESI